jgi:hypothetical protein
MRGRQRCKAFAFRQEEWIIDLLYQITIIFNSNNINNADFYTALKNTHQPLFNQGKHRKTCQPVFSAIITAYHIRQCGL